MLSVGRSARYRHQRDVPAQPRSTEDAEPVGRIKELIEQHPTYGYRRIWARLRFGDKRVINRKKVRQRPAALKLRVRRNKRVATRRNEWWALDAIHIDCGADGWGHLVAVIDCSDREIVGWEFALRGRANEAERALDMACLAQFGTLRPRGEVPVVRSDTGLIFPSRRLGDACRLYQLPQACMTPCTPEHHGLIERWFRSLKEACVWHHQFQSFAAARTAIAQWIRWS